LLVSAADNNKNRVAVSTEAPIASSQPASQGAARVERLEFAGSAGEEVSEVFEVELGL
jgi:hypothetical protein